MVISEIWLQVVFFLINLNSVIDCKKEFFFFEKNTQLKTFFLSKPGATSSSFIKQAFLQLFCRVHELHSRKKLILIISLEFTLINEHFMTSGECSILIKIFFKGTSMQFFRC